MTTIKILARAVLIFCILWCIGFLAFYTKIHQSNSEAKIGDGISVLTGGTGRLNAGLDLLKNNAGKKLLISGVDSSVTLDTLVALTGQPRNLFECCVTLDHSATNTIENAKETVVWAKAEDLTSITIVTAHYHMPRALLALEKYKESITIYAHPVIAKVSLRYLVIEYNKYIIALLTGVK